jgi:geranyl-CoA carboxylase alpha subunit
VRRQGEQTIVSVSGEDVALRLIARTDQDARVSVGGVARRASYARDGEDLWLDFDGLWRFADRTYAPPRLTDADADGTARSPVAGIVVSVEASVGEAVKRGQTLAVVEAMKMQYAILAPIEGVIREAYAVAGRQAEARALLFAITPQNAPSRG